jgi:hypothetical protein
VQKDVTSLWFIHGIQSLSWLQTKQLDFYYHKMNQFVQATNIAAAIYVNTGNKLN